MATRLHRDIEIDIGGLNPCEMGGGIDSISGLDAPSIEYSSVPKTQEHGVVLGLPYLRNRVITVSGDISGRDNIAEWRRLIAKHSINKVDFRFRHYALGSETYSLPECVVSNYSMPITFEHSVDYCRWSVQLVSSSPYYWSEIYNEVSTDDGDNIQPGGTVWPTGRVGTSNVWNLSVVNRGTVAVGCQFYLSDGVTDNQQTYEYVVENLRNFQSFSVTGLIYETYVIDSENRRFFRQNTADGNVSATLEGDYILLAPGENHIRLTNNQTPGDDVKLRVGWRSAWL